MGEHLPDARSLPVSQVKANIKKVTQVTFFSMVWYTYNWYWAYISYWIILKLLLPLLLWLPLKATYCNKVHFLFFAERNTLTSIMASFLSLSIEQQHKIRVLVFDFLETRSYSTQRQKTMLALETYTASFCGQI